MYTDGTFQSVHVYKDLGTTLSYGLEDYIGMMQVTCPKNGKTFFFSRKPLNHDKEIDAMLNRVEVTVAEVVSLHMNGCELVRCEEYLRLIAESGPEKVLDKDNDLLSWAALQEERESAELKKRPSSSTGSWAQPKPKVEPSPSVPKRKNAMEELDELVKKPSEPTKMPEDETEDEVEILDVGTKCVVLPVQLPKAKRGKILIVEEMVLNALSGVGFAPVGQSDLDSISKHELMKDKNGCLDVTCMVEVGNALGVDYVVSTIVDDFGGQFVLSFKLINTKHTEVVARSISESDTFDSLRKSIKSGVEQLALSWRE
jgi:hypothetical protein